MNISNRLAFTLNVSLLTLLASCGGGGGGGDGENARSVVPKPQYRVTAQAGTGGDISPSSQSVAANEVAEFQVQADEGFRIADVAGCGGDLEGTRYVTSAVTSECTVTASFEAERRYPVEGTINGLEGVIELALQAGEQRETVERSSEAGESTEFRFATEVEPGQAYEVQVIDAPEDLNCQLSNAFGEMEVGGAEPVEVECTPVATTASLSGRITPAANINVDSDINDITAPFEDNSEVSLAQPIHSRATLHGFASAEPTGGSEELERFAETADRDDYFRVSLEEGQLVQLQVVDHPSLDRSTQHEGDLDLFLYTATGEYIAHSDGTGQFEQVAAPENGSYLIGISAFRGISKYVLRISGVTEGTEQMGSVADFVPDQMVVKWRDNVQDTVDFAQVRSALGGAGLHLAHKDYRRATLAQLGRPEPLELGTQAQTIPKSGTAKRAKGLHQLNAAGYAKTETLKAIKKLRLRSDVEYAEPNYIRQASIVPDDPGYQYQWHYEAINLPLAWEQSINFTSYEPVVAVIDSGIVLDHPDLRTQLMDGFDFIRDTESARDGDGIDANPDDPGDSATLGQSSWHGTHVAGIVGAASNNRRGVAGVAWGARIMPIRVLGQGGATSYDVVQGLRYAAGLPNDSGLLPSRPADIANLSLGGDNGSVAEREAYREAREAGMIIVAAAGNESRSEPSYPAAYSDVISVSATDFLGQLAPYSNFGSTIALAAPGGYMAADANGDGYPDGVLSTLVDDANGAREPTYSFYHGTSMAAPHVAGVFALMKMVYPELTPDDVEQLLESATLTDDSGAPGRDDQYGQGIINAAKAVQAAAELTQGESPPEVPARIAVSPETLYLGYSTTAEVSVVNEGGADPQITAIETDADWLQVTPDDTDSAGLGSYRLEVDRSNLDDGAYRGTVTFSVDDGNLVNVRVYIQVGAVSTEATLTQLYVLLMEAESDRVIDAVSAELDGEGARYEFTDVPLGRYRIMAGSDIDVDSYICQSGESCGAYPTLERQQPVQLNGSDQQNLDFVANVMGSFAETASHTDAVQPLQYDVVALEKKTAPQGAPSLGTNRTARTAVEQKQLPAGHQQPESAALRPRMDLDLPD